MNADIFNSIVPLTAKRWSDAQANTERLIRERMEKPMRQNYRASNGNFPPILVVGMVLLLIVVAVGAFYISAGKEMAAANPVLGNMVSTFPRLTSVYVDYGMLFLLLMTEIGSFVFGFASKIVSEQKNITVILRGFQVLCVGAALVSNATITLSHPVPDELVFDWFLTLMPPSLVIGIGIVVEELLAKWLLSWRQANDAYKSAYKLYQEAQTNPQAHTDFYRVLGEMIIEQLMQASKHNKEVIANLIEVDPQARQVLAFRESERHKWVFDPMQKPIELSAVSSAISNETRLEGKTDAIRILSEKPELMKWLLADLVKVYGLSEATWSRAKAEVEDKP